MSHPNHVSMAIGLGQLGDDRSFTGTSNDTGRIFMMEEEAGDEYACPHCIRQAAGMPQRGRPMRRKLQLGRRGRR